MRSTDADRAAAGGSPAAGSRQPCGGRPSLHALTRRHVLGSCAWGFGALALGALFDRQGLRAADPAAPARSDPFAPKPPHFPAKAKAVIWLNMTGGPSQLDLFDDKPVLRRLDGQQIPESALKGLRFTSMTNTKGKLACGRWPFERVGRAGASISELLPGLKSIVDDVAIVKSLKTDEINHVPAQLLMTAGSPRMGRPVMGSWVGYGLGSMCADLPGYIVLVSGIGDRCGTACWSSGFLPSTYQGVQMRGDGGVLDLADPPGITPALRRAALDCVRDLDQAALARVGDGEIATRIAAAEMAFRMQTSVPGLIDLGSEPKAVLERYGAVPGQASFANNCLLARRLIERGVRFVQLNHTPWDHHGGSPGEKLLLDLPKVCAATDRPAAALVADLKARGLLDSTLVIWGGEFGRNPIAQGELKPDRGGRDHQGSAFTMWFAGGGVKPGLIGETDDFGMNVVADPVHVHDLQATVLHLLGMDHTRLTYRFQGRDFRLTDVHGEVVRKLLA